MVFSDSDDWDADGEPACCYAGWSLRLSNARPCPVFLWNFRWTGGSFQRGPESQRRVLFPSTTARQAYMTVLLASRL